ncbi:MAG TPA: hypothetical protein VGG64_30095 [Pirellulales bacterium]
MYDRSWLDELHKQLTRRRLPPAYVARLVDELSDHVTDSLEDQMSTDALQSRSVFDRLGAPHEVARRADNEFRQRSFCGRHPILMFVVLPLVVMAAATFASVLAVIAMGQLCKWIDPGISSDRLSPTAVGGMRLFCISTLLAPAGLTAAFFAWIAARGNVSQRWPIVTGAILGLLAGAAQLDMQLSAVPGRSSLNLGLGFSTALAETIFQLSKFAVPVLIGMWIFSRGTRRRASMIAS